MTPRSANIPHTEGGSPAVGQPRPPGRRPRLSWLRVLPLLARPISRTMPWVTLISGCLAGTGYLAVMARVADTSHSPLGLGAARLAFLPAIAALAFILRTPFRPLTQVAPVPAWLAPAGHIALAAPVLAITCWAPLRIVPTGGAVAAPISFAAIALAWYAPVTGRFLIEPPATVHAVTIAWYFIAAPGLALSCAAMRDQWHRYIRNLQRPSSPHRNPS